MPAEKEKILDDHHFKLPKYNPSQVLTEKPPAHANKMELDWNKVPLSRGDSNNSSFKKGITRLPFNPYNNVQLMDNIKGSGLEMKNVMPDIVDLNDSLGKMALDYPIYSQNAQAERSKRQAALDRVQAVPDNEGVKSREIASQTKKVSQKSDAAARGGIVGVSKSRRGERRYYGGGKASTSGPMVEEENNNGVVVRGGDTEAKLERIWVKPVQTQYFVYPILGPKIPS